MELHIIAIILIVFLVSLGSLLFISKLPKGKTFDEMLAEKRQLQEQLLRAVAEQPATGKSKDGGKKSGGGKKGQQQKKQKPLKGKGAAQKVQESESTQSSDSEESSASDFNDMEFIETEQFNILSAQQQRKKNQQQQAPKKTKLKTGILVNKIEPSLVVAANEVETVQANHFEQTHPKDVVAMKTEKSEDGDKEAKLQAKNVKDTKKNKQQNAKKEQSAIQVKQAVVAAPIQLDVSPPIPSKNVVAPAKPQEKPMPQRAALVVAEEKPKFVEPAKVETVEPVKEKVNKKKKVEGSGKSPKLVSAHEDEHVNALIHTIGHTELTHNEIQLLIEFLLNKQQDTISKDPTEWTEGKSDVMQKLKKQLQECGKQLLDEKQASVAFQNKLRELRTEMNNEKVMHAAQTKACLEQINIKGLDIQTLNNEVKYMSEKFATEKQQLTQQYQQLQAKWMQLTNKDAATQVEYGQQIQQLKDTNTLLQQDLANKNKMVAEMQIFAKQNSDTVHKMGELEQKFQDYEMMLRKKDEHIGFLQQDQRGRDDEIHRLKGELQRQKEDFDQVLQQQLGDLQAKQQAVAAANHHDEENSKVEIKNLQNALDSAKNGSDGFKQQVDELQAQIATLKTELTQSTNKRNEQNDQAVTEFNKKVAAYEAQINELNSKEVQILQQLEEQKTKNNHLQQNQQPKIDVEQIVLDEQIRTKELFAKILPDLPAAPSDDYNKWIEHVVAYFKTQLTSSSSSSVDKQTTTNDNGSITTTTTTTTHKVLHNNSHNNGNSGGDGADDGEEVEKVVTEEITKGSQQSELSSLLFKNVELQQVVEEYKSNLAKAYQLLDSLQAKADEQDDHWRQVMQAKENEMVLLMKKNAVATTNNVTTEAAEQMS